MRMFPLLIFMLGSSVPYSVSVISLSVFILMQFANMCMLDYFCHWVQFCNLPLLKKKFTFSLPPGKSGYGPVCQVPVYQLFLHILIIISTTRLPSSSLLTLKVSSLPTAMAMNPSSSTQSGCSVMLGSVTLLTFVDFVELYL